MYNFCIHNWNPQYIYILQRCADASRDDSAAPCCKVSLQNNTAAAKKEAWKFAL